MRLPAMRSPPPVVAAVRRPPGRAVLEDVERHALVFGDELVAPQLFAQYPVVMAVVVEPPLELLDAPLVRVVRVPARAGRKPQLLVPEPDHRAARLFRDRALGDQAHDRRRHLPRHVVLPLAVRRDRTLVGAVESVPDPLGGDALPVVGAVIRPPVE